MLTCMHAWADRARKELADIFATIIKARRASGSQEDDILQSFIDSRYEKVVPCPHESMTHLDEQL